MSSTEKIMGGSIEYRKHPEIDGYFISDIGDVVSFKFSNAKFLSKHLNKRTGYYSTNISIKAKQKMRHVHRLVMEAFYGVSSLHINHKDGDRTNNHKDNLEYCTPSYNHRHKNFGLKRFVSYDKRANRYYVRIKIGTEYKYFGMFENEKEAYDHAHKTYTEHFEFEPWSK